MQRPCALVCAPAGRLASVAVAAGAAHDGAPGHALAAIELHGQKGRVAPSAALRESGAA